MTDFIDHERIILNRFRCPQCGNPLQVIQIRQPTEVSRPFAEFEDTGEVIGACDRCKIGMSRDVWHRDFAR